MKSRFEILRKKSQEVLEEVSRWAEGELLLRSDEYISVVLEIKKKVLIIETPQEKENIPDMPLLDFFSPQRCIDVVADKSLYTKIKNRLTEESVYWRSLHHNKNIGLRTVRDLIIFGRTRLLAIQHFGKATVRKINQMLVTEGLKLDE